MGLRQGALLLVGAGLAIPEPTAGGSGPAAPTLSSLSEPVGDVLGGGQPIVLTGSGFTAATDVRFGTTSASFVVDSDTQITATLPAHAAGSVLVTVVGPGGASSEIVSFEFWSPRDDASEGANVTLVRDSLSHPYVPASDAWPARYSLVSGGTAANVDPANRIPAADGAPVFDGDGADDVGLITTATWADYLGPDVSGECEGGVLSVFSSTTNSALDLVTAPYGNPQIIGNENGSSGTIGIGFGNDGTTPSVCAHIYEAGIGYRALAVPAAAGALHAVAIRFGTGATSFDLSVDGALTGPSFASVAMASGTATTYTPYPMSYGLEYPDNVASSQTIAGTLKAQVVMKTRPSDAFLTKFYAWSKQRFGVA